MPGFRFCRRRLTGWTTAAILVVNPPLPTQYTQIGVSGAAPTGRREIVARYYEAYARMSRDHTQHMDAWLAFFDDSIFFEDPTAGLKAFGREPIRKAYADAITSGGYGAIDFRVERFVDGGDWVAVEGILSVVRSGKPVNTRFSTWFRFRGDRIVHQIDYVSYRSMNQQVRGTGRSIEPLADSPGGKGKPMTPEAMSRVVRDFFDAYGRVALDSTRGIDRVFRFYADSLRFEDPTALLSKVGSPAYRVAFERAFAQSRWGRAQWVITRQLSRGEWVAVEGIFAGVVNEYTFSTRFTTWLQLRDGRITRQIDYFDTRTLQSQTSRS